MGRLYRVQLCANNTCFYKLDDTGDYPVMALNAEWHNLHVSGANRFLTDFIRKRHFISFLFFLYECANNNNNNNDVWPSNLTKKNMKQGLDEINGIFFLLL